MIHATPWMNLENILLSEKKPYTKGDILNDPIYTKYPKQINPERQNTDCWLQGWGVEESGEKLLNG